MADEQRTPPAGQQATAPLPREGGGSLAASGTPLAALEQRQAAPPRITSAALAADVVPPGDVDALKVLLQASAAAESLQQRFAELRHRQSDLNAERTQLSADRSAFEKRAREFAEQVAGERAAQREATADVENRTRQVKQLQESLAEQQAELQTARENLKAERQRMQTALTDELAREKESLQQYRDALEQQKQQLTARAELLEQQHTERTEQANETLQTERDQMRDLIRKELTSEMDQLNREKHEWQQQRDAQKLELQEAGENLQQQRELFGEQLDAEQLRLRDEIEKRRQALLTEQNNLQRRYRFQFEHLTRAREDFEQELRQLRREQQAFRSERRAFDEQHRLRFRQLQHIRSLLLQRETSLLREHKVIDRSRSSATLDLERQKARLQEHQDAVMQDLQSRSRQIRQQEETSAAAARRLEERSLHLHQLRAELDGKQRDMLEQRLLLEEAQAALNRLSPDDAGQAAVRQARTELQQFFEQLHEQLRTERRKLDERAHQLAEQQQMFRKDRADLQQWFEDRERGVSATTPSSQEAALTTQLASLQDELVSVRKRWNADRTESEVTIRDLLDQLVTAETRAFNAEPPLIAELPVDEPAVGGSTAPETDSSADGGQRSAA